MMRKIIFILVVCLVALSSCQWDGKSGNTADVDVRVARYDRLQYEYVTMNSFSALQKMNTDYPQVTKLLIEDVLAIGEVDDMKINDRMLEYYSDSTLLTLMHDAEEKFKDLSWDEEKLRKEISLFSTKTFYKSSLYKTFLSSRFISKGETKTVLSIING